MRKLLVALTLLTLIASASAVQYINTLGANQSIGNTNNLFIDNTNGRVGVGVTSPTQKLEVRGLIYSSSLSSSGTGILVDNPENNAANVQLNWLNNISRIRYGGTGAGATGGFQIQGPGDAVRLTVNDTGGVIIPSGLTVSAGTVTIPAGQIDETEIAQNSLDDSEIQDNSLTAASLAANSVGTSEIAANSVADSELFNGGTWNIGSTLVIDNSAAGAVMQLIGGAEDNTSFEWVGFYSGATREGILLWDAAWATCANSATDFCLVSENGNRLVLASGSGTILLNDNTDITGDLTPSTITMSGTIDTSGTIDAGEFTEDGSATLSNDITGSAGTLDGIDSLSFLRSDTADSYTGTELTVMMAANQNIDNSTGNLGPLEIQQSTAGADAFMTFHVVGDHAAYFGLDGGINDFVIGGWSKGSNSYRVWHANSDGSGSGLDADLLDNIDSGSFFILSQNETVTGVPAFNGGTTGSIAPFTVDSTFVVTNLNADLLDGISSAGFDQSTTNELQNIFQTVSTTSGTAPVADTTTDTLTLTAGGGITVTGDSTTDTVTIANSGDTTADTIADDGTITLTTETAGNYVANVTAGNAITVGGSAGEGWTASIAVTAGSIDDNEIAQNTIDDSEITDNILTALSLATNSVGADEIAANAVGASEIAADAVGDSELMNSGTWTTTGTLTIGDNNDDIVISSANWDADADGDVFYRTLEKTYTSGSTGMRVIHNPDGAFWGPRTNNIAGALQISLPVGMTNTMMQLIIHGFEYDTDSSWTMIVGGYNNNGGWNNEFATILSGNPPFTRVRFGNDTITGNAKIVLGTVSADGAATDFDYPWVWVSEVMVGYSGVTNAWESGWSMTNVSTLAGLTISGDEQAIEVWNANNDGSGSGLDADTLDGISSAGFDQTSDTIADDGLIQETEIAQNTIDDSEIQDNSLTAASLAANSVADSELFNGGDWITTSNLNIGTNAQALVITIDGVLSDEDDALTINDALSVTGAITATTLDTGQGANELYDMDQNVLTTSSPTFAGLTVNAAPRFIKTAHAAGASDYHLELYSADTGSGSNEVSLRFHQGAQYWGQIRYRNGGFRFTDGNSDTLTSVSTGALVASTLDTGQGANELYDMNQNVQTSDSVTFADLTVTAPPIFGTSSSGASARTITFLEQGDSQTAFGQYPGAWRSGLQIQGNDPNYLFFLVPPEADGSHAHFRSVVGGMQFNVGGTTANQGVNAITISSTGAVTLTDLFSAGSANLMIGDDTYLSDIDVAQTLGLYSASDTTQGWLRFGSGGGTIGGTSGGNVIVTVG